ncbi:HEAT repeat domain-containing protein [Streptomyces sp. sk2.1]|uniref:HEAT repeat domain-containing protein n=1 Tax=Streptomyces sp. sk2.1 TaxID=2478959 RepID=UPI0011E64443|nr:HEAT repeat domain-containing protein [Streptomyces sp. sk2.1]TXS77835.1 HEAT repeat domain-containing protein [Streptomyces sp. sk2.1]
MRKPADTHLHDAVDRAGTGPLSGLPDARDCPPDALGRLIRHEDPARRHLGLVLLDERLAACGPADDGERAELAALLPKELMGPPEADLLLAGLYERLAPHLRGHPRPSWRTAGALPDRVRTAWLRADLLHDPAVLRDEAPGELLHRAVRETDITAAHHPARLVDELAAAADPVLRAEAVRLVRQGLHAGLLAPAPARARLTGLLGTDDPRVVVDALTELAEPWAATEPLPRGRLAPFLTTGTGDGPEGDSVRERPEAAEAALAAAARHGHRDLLREAVEDPGLPPVLRRRAMELLGDLADRDDIGALTALAARDPLLLGGPAVTCLRGLHRRGHFPRDPDVPAVVGLALADHSIPPREVATVLFTTRKEAFRVLVEAAADAPDWPRRLALLVALAGQGADDLPVGDAITRLLPSAPAPAPFLDAIRELRHEAAEEAVLALLPSAPAAALETLEAIGGPRTVRALRDGLGIVEDPPAPDGIAPHLRAVRDRALEILWQLTDDPEARHDLLTRLDPRGLPPRVAAGLGGPDERELALLSSHPDPDEPVAALCGLAAHGTAATLPAIADLLLRVVADRAASWRPDAPARTGEHGQPAGEPVVPQEVLDAVAALGGRLHGRGAIRPVCLLGAADVREAGHALVATTALDLLDRPGLSDAERAILLEALLRAPWAGTRARVHRMLRHRDRHVRKHVIALLARDATGEDAQALSASLTALTTARDIQTVRQALHALGHARAHWASTAIAACLDHPNMNIRKTAAEALVRAGTPAALPKLLFRLGHDDNPGLRTALLAALRTILGDARAATLLAAAEHGRDARSRELLLAGLDGALTVRAILALEEQRSPVAAELLALVASGRVAAASGDVDALAPALARHGIAAPDAGRPPAADAADLEADRDVAALVAGGWNPSLALRIADRDGPLRPGRADELRPMLDHWLRLAGSRPAHRRKVIRFALRICATSRPTGEPVARTWSAGEPAAPTRPAGEPVARVRPTGESAARTWSAGELAVLARSAGVLLDALADARDEDRHDLIAVLEEAAPMTTAARRPSAIASVRALRPAPAAPHRSTLTLLRRLGAVPVRADLDRALAGARLGADPWRAETAVLREAFTVPEPGTAPLPAGTRAWRATLEAAVRTPDGPAELRGRDDGTVPSQDRLNALIEAYRGADDPAVREALLDWMAFLQPLDAPPCAAPGADRATPPPRHVRADDLDQPRSAAQYERLLTMLDSDAADHRDTAARALARWPEPEARLAVLRAHLRGRVELPPGADPARALAGIDEAELRGDGVRPGLVARAAARLGPAEREPLVPLLLEWWEHAPAGLGAEIAGALHAHPADALAEALGERLAAGAWGFLDLLVGRPLLRTPALTETCRRLRAEGRDELADRLRLVEGPLRGPDAARRDAAALAALRERGTAAPADPARPPSRRELLDLARAGTPEQICRALTELAGEHPGPDAEPDRRLHELLDELITHPRPEVRLRAHRTSRVVLDRPAHLRLTASLLDDPRPDVVRMAIRTLCRAGWEPAAPAVTGLLAHPHAVVRGAAAEGLVELGPAAVPALRKAAARARPDRRSRYTSLLDRIGNAKDGAPTGR